MVLESAEATRSLGRSLGRLLRGGDAVFLVGDLGSGKTTFTQGVALGAGFRGQVASPTFVLVRRYEARAVTIYHIDFYRVAAGETRDIGLEDYVGDPRGACVVEWPAAGEGYLPPDRLEVRLAYGEAEGERKVAMRAFGPRSRALLRGLSRRGGGIRSAAGQASGRRTARPTGGR